MLIIRTNLNKVAAIVVCLIVCMMLVGCDKEKVVPSYTVTFDSDGGSAVVAQTVIEGEKAKKPENPTKEGYGFSGWYKETSLTSEWNFVTDVVKADMMLYAKWAQNMYVVTFNSDGGSVVLAQTIAEGAKATEPSPTPTKEGYTFSGWYKESGLTNEWKFDTDVVIANIALYAKWEQNMYVVTFNSNGGSIVPSIQVSHGYSISVATLVDTSPTRTGFDFNGWHVDSELTNPIKFPFIVTDNITLYAGWTPVTDQNGYLLKSKYFIWKCGSEPLVGNISPENFSILLSQLDLSYEAMQELTGFTPENGRQINIELLAEDDWAGGRGGGGYIGISRNWISHYMQEVDRDNGAPNGILLHELGHNFDWSIGQRWFNAEMGATTLAYYARDKLNLEFYHDYAGRAMIGSDWIEYEYLEILNRYNRGETTTNDYEWDFFICLWKLFHETNWEPLKAVYHSYSDRFEIWDFMDRLSRFSKIPVDTYFYSDLNKWIREVYPNLDELIMVSPIAMIEQVMWRYTFAKPASNWVQQDFNDSAWREGMAGFGTYGTPGSIIGTVWNTSDIWLRRSFEWNGNKTKNTTFTLILHHDEDVEVYLNGVKVFEKTGYLTSYVVFHAPILQEVLRTGINQLAVHCKQTDGGQYIDVGIICNPD